MIAVAPSLPPLTPQQAQALQSLLTGSDIFAPVRSGEISLPDLLTALSDPAVQAHIEEVRRLSALALEIRASQAAHSAIVALERTLSANPDPTEQRRAATTILRALGPTQHACKSRRTSPRTHPSPRTLTPQIDDQPAAVADLAAQFLMHQGQKPALTSFFNYLMPDATLDHEYPPTRLRDFLDDAPHIPLAPVTGYRVESERIDGDHAAYTLKFTHGALPPTRFAISLHRPDRGPNSLCWMIDEIARVSHEPPAGSNHQADDPQPLAASAADTS